MAVQGICATSSPLTKHLSPLVPTITSLLERKLNPPQNAHSQDPSFLDKFSPHLTNDLVIQIIKHQSNPYHSLFFFNWASNLNHNPSNYFHSFHCYIAITDKLISRNLFSVATRLLVSRGKFSDFMVGKFIKAHGDLGHLKSAVKLFHKVKLRESGNCLYSYNALLGVLIKARRLRLAWGYFGWIIKEGVVEPDVSTYTIMIRGFCQAGMIEYAKKLFDEMRCEKTIFTYNSMVDGFVKKGLMANARSVFEEMVKNGTCLPDRITYTTLIDGYCRTKEITEAMRCFDEMADTKVEPNSFTYNALINGLCSNGNVDEAKRLMTRMRLSGLKDTIASHTSLLKGYCIVGRSDEAIKHFKEMVSLGMELDEKSYAVIVNEYCKLRIPDEAVSLLKEMRVRGINPIAYNFNAVLRSLLELDQLDKAVNLLKQMPQMGCQPNFISYGTVIQGLLRAKGRLQDVEMLISEMLRDGYRTDATLYNDLIKGYVEDGNEERAMQIFVEMIDQSYVISLECFKVFVKQQYAKGKFFEVENLFEQMKKRCPVGDIISFQNILDECLC